MEVPARLSRERPSRRGGRPGRSQTLSSSAAQRHEDRAARLGPDLARAMPLARQIFSDENVAGPDGRTEPSAISMSTAPDSVNTA